MRILDAGTVLATHRRSFDRGGQVEDPAHIAELEREKRLAREHRATDRLHHAAPSSKALFVAAAERNHHLGVLARGLIALLNAHGPAALERAIAAALQSDAAHLGGVRHFIDQHRKESDKPPPLALDLPDDPRLRTLSVRPTTSPTTTASTTNPTPATRTQIAMTTMNKTPTNDSDSVRQRLRAVGLYGLAVQDAALLAEPWVERVIDIEDRERKRRSLERRLANARIGAFKPVADFDWGWPKRIDRPLIEELFSLTFVDDATNVVFVGPNGVGKTMLREEPPPPWRAQRPHRAVHHRLGHAPRARRAGLRRLPCPAAASLHRPSAPRHRRGRIPHLRQPLRRPPLRGRHPPLSLKLPVLITTNKPFSEWADVFSSAACVVTLVDRLIHRSEIVQLDGESYRLREAKEQAARRSKARSRRSAKSRASRGTRS